MEPELPEGEGRGEAAEEGLIEFYGSFKEMFEFFCKNTTIHGTIRLVCSGRNRMKTAFWTLLLLASLGMLYWQFALMFSQFWAYPVVLTMSMDSEPKMFPAVTICNLDPSRFELVSEQLEQLERMAEESLTFLYGPKASARLSQLRDRNRDRDKDGAIRVQAWANLSSAGFRLSHNFSLVRMWDPRAGEKHSRVGFRLCNSTGLSLILRAEQKEHLPLLSTVAGVKVMIHSHNQTPFLEHEGFHIRPGIATTIGIRQDQVNRLGGNYGRCTTDGADVAVELLYNNSYTLQACLHSCFQRAMVQRCGCGYFYYPLPAGARYCDYSRQPAWGHCFYQLYSRLRNHRLDCFQHCPKPCRESLYKVSAGTAKWPSAKSQDWVRQALRHQNGYNSSSSRRDIAKVTIFYRQLSSQAVHEAPLLSENLLLSSMGSQWSLWFGSSVLSVVEMLELLLDTLVLSLLFCLQRLRPRRGPGGSGANPSASLALGSAGELREQPGNGQGGARGAGLGQQLELAQL
ncbi:hypothetical protein EK904_014955 [Melospiza melodia maxima]|nr:hypothetical protein EK904_014955 [Melospiza melodia maxima]